ncbi:MAG TPA: hypothetical protein VIX84_13110 [Acidimicrobiales bacterium]
MSVPVGPVASNKARIGLVILACLIGLSVTAGGPASVAAASTNAAQQALERSLSAAKGVGSVRITVEFFSGSTTGKVVQDSSVNSGEQTVAIGKEVASVVLVGGVAYISANGQGMTSYFGLPSSLVPTLAGRRISVHPTDSSFQAVTANVSLASALSNVTPSGTLVTGKRSRVGGQPVNSVAGTAPGGGGQHDTAPTESGEHEGSSWGDDGDEALTSNVVCYTIMAAAAPEAPSALLFPVAGLVVVGGWFFLSRRRGRTRAER